MKKCDICGKEIEQSDAYENNGVVQCKECMIKSLNLESFDIEAKDNKNNIKSLIFDSSNPLISIMKKLIVISGIVFLLFSIVASISSFRGYAFLYMILFIFTDCMTVGMLLVILNYFDDITAIKNNIEKK